MTSKITYIILVKNLKINNKVNLFETVISQASKLSKRFVIINNNSKDNTKEIIFNLKKKYSINLTYFEDQRKEFDYLKYEYSKKIKTEYIFSLDDDEVITNKLIKEIIHNIDKKFKVFKFNLNSYLGKNIFHYSYSYRLFSKNFNIFNPDKSVHNFINLKKIKKCNKNYIFKSKNEIKHYTYNNLNSLFEKINFYSKFEAEAEFKRNPNLLFIQIIFGIIFESLFHMSRNLIINKCYKSKLGIMYSLTWWIYKLKKYFYYMELQKFGENKK